MEILKLTNPTMQSKQINKKLRQAAYEAHVAMDVTRESVFQLEQSLYFSNLATASVSPLKERFQERKSQSNIAIEDETCFSLVVFPRLSKT